LGSSPVDLRIFGAQKSDQITRADFVRASAY